MINVINKLVLTAPVLKHSRRQLLIASAGFILLS